MPVVSTDDAARRLRYIWLGPTGWRLPFDARFPAWGVALLTGFLWCAASYAFAPTGRLALLGCLLAPAPAIFLTRKVMRHVDHDRSLRHWKAVMVTELDTPRTPTKPLERRITTPPALFDKGNHRR